VTVCAFVSSSTAIYVSMAAQVDATDGTADALIVHIDGSTEWVPAAITITGDPVEPGGDGSTTGCE